MTAFSSNIYTLFSYPRGPINQILINRCTRETLISLEGVLPEV